MNRPVGSLFKKAVRKTFEGVLYPARDRVPPRNQRFYYSSRPTPAFGICLPHRKRGQDLVDGCCAVVREPKLACFSRSLGCCRKHAPEVALPQVLGWLESTEGSIAPVTDAA